MLEALGWYWGSTGRVLGALGGTRGRRRALGGCWGGSRGCWGHWEALGGHSGALGAKPHPEDERQDPAPVAWGNPQL